MRRIRYSVAMSLDGYIAGPNGESDWIVMDPDIDFGAIFGQFDTILMGRKTYEMTRGSNGDTSMPGVKVFVASRTLRAKDHPNVTILDDDLKGALIHLCEQRGNDIWLVGGGDLFRTLVDLKRVDTVEVAVVPVLLGGGIAMLLPPAKHRAKLKLTNQKDYPKTGTMSLDYAVDYGSG